MPNINAVEIFAVGTWNGDTYSVNDLQEMVDNFNETKSLIKPYLKLGHNDEQELLKKDGLPAAGWIENLRLAGEKLVADFVEVPEKIYQLIKNKAYKKVSSEIFWNLKVGEKSYNRLLSGVALLGSDLPAVSTLSDILALYNLKEENNIVLKSYQFINEEREKMDELEKQLLEAKELLEAEKKEKKELLVYKAKAEEEKQQAILEKQEAEKKNFILELEKENLCTAAMKPLIEQLLGEEKKEYTLEEKSYSKSDLLKKCLSLYKEASKVNFDENSLESQKVDLSKEEQIEEEIQKYIEQNKCSYAHAYKSILGKKETNNEE